MQGPRLWLPPDADPLTDSLDQVRAWIAFYRDLAAVEERMLEDMRRVAEDLPEAQRTAVEMTNIQPMVDFVSDLQDRRRFWLERQKELTGRGKP
jgi:hypothetical protein